MKNTPTIDDLVRKYNKELEPIIKSEAVIRIVIVLISIVAVSFI